MTREEFLRAQIRRCTWLAATATVGGVLLLLFAWNAYDPAHARSTKRSFMCAGLGAILLIAAARQAWLGWLSSGELRMREAGDDPADAQ